MSDTADATIPEGFSPMAMGGPFIRGNGPLYAAREGGRIRLGLRIDERHCNAMGVCHGGMLATFVDMLLPVTIHHQGGPTVAGRFLPTVSLQLDFMAPVQRGDWLEADGQVLKVTRSLVFVQGLARVAGRAVLRCSGVYKIGPEFAAGSRGIFTHESPAAPVPPPAS